MAHLIETPEPADAAELAELLLAGWLETYPHQGAGIDEPWIRTQRADQSGAAGAARWREFTARAAAEPQRCFCRVVRQRGAAGGRGAAVGVLCGLRAPVEGGGTEVSLGPMYLRASVQGRGLGGRLMAEFLAWAEPDPIALWVTEYNEPAVRFYLRHGFRPTGERELWRERLPNLRLRRPPTVAPH
ncbi:GNAT family N-acetyltransferase [Kitasatospora sp. LaBMicrA B282]|uniref:GNAT family N-acetyltransferase n=1 Tax=Kitasatospora sp. LaBMicrA B282 TaxID=3420949 RepID=UPI003D116411